MKSINVDVMMKRFSLLVLAMTAVISGFAQGGKVQVVDKVVAVVGKNIILQSDVETQYIQYRMEGIAEGNASAMHFDQKPV